MLTKLRQLLRNGDAKKLLESLFSLGVLELISYIFPLITIPYLARTIGVDRFGDLALAVAVVMYFQVLVDWGYNYLGVREVARHREDREIVSLIYSRVFWGRFVLIYLSFVILVALTLVVPRLQTIALPLFFRFLVIFGYWLYSDWLFQGLEEMRYITIFNLCSSCLCTLSIFIFIKSPDDYIYQPLLMSMGFVISGLISFAYVSPSKGIHLQRIPFIEVFRSLREGVDIFFNQATSVYLDQVSILLLGLWHPARANGLFDAGYKPLSVVQRFSSILSRAFYPLLARRIEQHRLFAIISLSLATLFSVICFVSAPMIIELLFAPEFAEASTVLRIIAPSIIFSTLINVYGVNYLVQVGEERLLRNTTLLAVGVSLLIAFPLIYNCSWIGTAIAYLITKAILGISITYQTLRLKKCQK